MLGVDCLLSVTFGIVILDIVVNEGRFVETFDCERDFTQTIRNVLMRIV